MNTIEFEEMRWGNIFSYGENNFIKFNEERVTQIIGINGAGKSSIPLILEEGTYNKNSKGFKKADIPNRHINKPYYIEYDFCKGEDKYTFSVKKAATLKATFTKNGEDISAHTATATFGLFEEEIGFNFKTFTQLIYQNTRSSLQFLTATDAKRKEFLIELFDMSEYVEKHDKFSASLKDLIKDLNKLEGSIEALQLNVSRYEQLSTQITEIGVEVPEFPEDLLDERARLQTQLENIQKENKNITEGNKILTQLADLRDPEEIQAEIEAIQLEDKSPLIELVGRRNADISAAKKVVEKIQGLSGQCPTCLQSVDEQFIRGLIEENNDIISKNRAEATEVVARIKAIEDAEKSLRKLQAELSQRQNIESKKKFDVYQETLDYEELEVRVKEVGIRIQEAKAAIDDAIAGNKIIDARNAKINAASEQLEELKVDLETLSAKYDELYKKKGPLEVLKKAFSSSGLIAYKLENLVLDLEVETNKYLGRLSDGQFNLTFELQNDKLNVVILNNGHEVSMTTLSSGQEARVVIGTLLGIRKIMQSISKQTINILFLDEVISVMDDLGKEQLVEVLMDEPGLNTFLVSHGWTHPLVTKLEVVMEDGISRIQ